MVATPRRRNVGPKKRGGAKRHSKRRRPKAAPAEGLSAVLLIDEWGGGAHEQVCQVVRIGAAPQKPSLPKRVAASVGRRRFRASAATCRAFAAVGHPTRAKLLGKLVEGPATYRALQTATKLAAGPLYHHINQLRLTGLILPKPRDLYELTRGGRNLVVTMAALEPLLRDSRRRPVGA